MEAKEVLRMVYKTCQSMERQKERVEELRAELQAPSAIRYDGVRVQHNRNIDRLENDVTRLDEAEKELLLLIDEYLQTYSKVLDLISASCDAMSMRVLFLHFFPDKRHRFRTLKQVASEMQKTDGLTYSKSHISRINQRGLQQVNKLLQDPEIMQHYQTHCLRSAAIGASGSN